MGQGELVLPQDEVIDLPEATTPAPAGNHRYKLPLGDTITLHLNTFSLVQKWLLTSQPLAANLKQTEDRIDELNGRKEGRLAELEQERQCMIGGIQHFGKAWVLPHPERNTPQIRPMVVDPEIERIAVQFVIQHEQVEGRVVESVGSENRGFDLISRRPHPEDPKTALEVRFIEVKGRSGIGEIVLTSNEYKTAKRLRKDYCLYIVTHCATEPTLNILNDPSTLDWQPVVKIEQYRLRQDSLKHPVELKEEVSPYHAGGEP